jgi:predicted regulator of Ras-like GTPase activity (Roadblock/LC7/MglB family)
MTVAQKTTSTGDLTWLVDDLINRVGPARHAVVLSADGLLIASSGGLGRDDAEHLSAVAAGFQSLARGAGRRFGGGSVRQTIVEMDSAFLFVTAAGSGACLAVLAAEDADVGLIAYEMAMIVTRVGQYLTTPVRAAARPDE